MSDDNLVGHEPALAQSAEPDPAPTPAPDPKPGWQTTEFWLHLLASLLSIVVAIGLISATQADSLGKAIGAAIAAVFAVIGAMNYGSNRTKLKSLQ